MEFRGYNVLITGGSRGIGAGIAYRLASYGLKIWINYNESKEEAIRLKSRILRDFKNVNIELIQFNVCNEEEVIHAYKYIYEQDKKLSYLVNNAGITKDAYAMVMEVDDFRQVIEVNTIAYFLSSREALKIMMKESFGSIVNISSISGEIGNIGQVNYSASKGAIIAMTKTLAKEGAKKNIRFNAITPGLIQTDMISKLTDKDLHQFLDNIPLKKAGKVEDVAYSVAFLLSDFSEYITGEVLKVNGGLHM